CDLQAPVRRSQKLGDRITALQKLVSPFGKTDTASVLHEAYVHIKLLQEQVQMLSAPYFRTSLYRPQELGSKEEDLRSRGLCLVPISLTQNLNTEERTECSLAKTFKVNTTSSYGSHCLICTIAL
ncbi:transcription factor bHLH110-like, partial [Telopea speciosissima]|uniref:transcription factor bHLH110-like n=1 Tax=Telopea speciosissima TaxID=54955 RepID=UPI001CC54B61